MNAAFQGVKNYDTGMLCQLWTFGNYPLHIANNQDYTVTPNNGKMVLKQGCTQHLLGRPADRCNTAALPVRRRPHRDSRRGERESSLSK